MAGAKNTQQSSTLVTLKLQTLLTISILINVFYVEPNIAGRSIDALVADDLRVNEGKSAVLRCSFSPSNAVIGKWYWKTNETVIIRSDDPPNPNSRYSLGDAKSGNVSLVIKEVLRWDKGTYTCGVNDQSTGSTVPHSDNSKLTVNYLDKPKIQALTDTRVPEGTRVSMSCKVVASYPEVSSLTWFHERVLIDSASGRYIFNDEILEIKKIDQRDKGNYSCRAENEFFVGKNGKYSNTIAFSLKKEEAIPPSSSSSQILVVFIVVPVLIISLVVLAMYFLKKRSKNKHRFCNFISKTVIRKDRNNEIYVERALDDLIPAEFPKRGYEENLEFNVRVLMVARGGCTRATFISTYESEHSCFKLPDGHYKPFFTMLLLSCNWPDKVLHKLYSSEKGEYERITGEFKDNGTRKSIEFSFELKKNVTDGATGYLIFNDVTDDDEGQYIYLLQIKKELKLHGEPQEITHAFYGRTSIQLTNAIYRSSVYKQHFISPIGIVLNCDQVYAFAVKTEKEKTEGQAEDKTILRYITCAGRLQSKNNNVTIKWNDVAQVLLKPEEELLSFVALPGRYHSHIFLAYINVSEDRRLLGHVFSFLPDGSFKLINNIVETLTSEGPFEILKFDPLSGKKLSNGRLVVGGWIKRAYQRKRMGVFKSRFTGPTSCRGKHEDVEIQMNEYEPFIMWTDDEINWNLGENLKIDEAEKNMRIQVTEIGNRKGVVLIISSLYSKEVLYEGQSNDYCTTFAEKNKEWHFKIPVVSFAITNGSLIGVSSMEYINEISGQQQALSSAKKVEGSSVNKMKENLPEIDEPANDETETSTLEKPSADSVEVSFKNVPKLGVFSKAASKANKAFSFNSRESSTSKSTQKYESVPTIEIPSINNDNSPGTNKLTNDEKVSTLEKPSEDSMERSSEKVKKRRSLGRGLADRFSFSSKKASSVNEQTKESVDDEKVIPAMEAPTEDSMQVSSDNVKEWSSFGRLAKKVGNKLPTKSKRESSENKLTKDSESASFNDESSFIKDESTEKIIRESSSESNKVTENDQVMPIMEAPPEDAMEDISEGVKKQSSIGRLAKTVSNKLLTKLKRESFGSILTRDSEIEVTSNAIGSSSQIQDRSAWEGLWHLEQDTTNNKAIRLRPVKDNKCSSDTTYDFVTILENRKEVQCEQILPFTCKGKSWFLMIYKTHFINDKDDEPNHSLCTRYHVFSLDKIMSGI